MAIWRERVLKLIDRKLLILKINLRVGNGHFNTFKKKEFGRHFQIERKLLAV